MASYLQNPSFGSYGIQPYMLPTQQIVQAIGARQNAFDEQASKLKLAYQSYLGLDLGLEANQQKLDSLMQGVNDGLKKAVRTDLSISQNGDEAMKIFDPIIKDEGIRYDNLYTKQIKEQISTAQNLRTQNGGKEYSDTNLGYLTKPYQDFVKNNDPKQARMAYASRRFYTPYHDVSAEQKDLYKNFKPDVTKFTKPTTGADGKLDDSGYRITQENKSIMASQYRAYLNANLSDKAKEQLHIDGVMTYRDNLHALANDYISHNTEQIDSYTQSYNEAIGKSKGIKDPKLQAQYESEAKDFLQKSQELKSINNKLINGDLSEVQKNKESIAGGLYTSNYIQQLAEASKRLDITTTYDPDITSLTKFKENLALIGKREEIAGREKVEGMKEAADLKLEQYKLTHTKGANGEKYDENGNIIIATSPDTALGTGLNNEKFGQEQLDKLGQDAYNLKMNSFSFLNDQLTNAVTVNGKPLFTSDMNITQKKAAFDTWANEKNDKGEFINHRYVYNEFQRQQRLAQIKEDAYNTINKSIDDELKSKLGTESKEAREALANNITSSRPILLVNQATGKYETVMPTIEELKAAAKGDNSNIKISIGKEWLPLPGGIQVSGFDNLHGDKINILNYKGKQYELPNSSLQSGYNTSSLAQLSILNSTLEDKTSKARNEIVNKAITRMKGIEDFQDPGAKYLEPIRDKIANSIGTSGFKKDNIALTARDNSGGLYFKLIPDKELGINNFQDAKKELEKLYGSDSYIKADGTFYIPRDKVGSDILKPRIYNIPGMDDIKTTIEFKNSNRGDNQSFYTSPFKIGNEDFQIGVNKVGGQPTYTLMHSKSGAIFTQLNDTPFLNIEEATLQAKKLSDLKTADPQQFNKLIKTIGGQPNYTGQ